MAGTEEPHLSSLALKLSPQRNLLLQAWLTPSTALRTAPQLISVWSAHTAQANAWYHITVVSSRGRLQMYVNGQLEADTHFDGLLAPPSRPSDGDVSFIRRES